MWRLLMTSVPGQAQVFSELGADYAKETSIRPALRGKAAKSHASS